MNYIKKHWRGKCSLAVSFWINLVLINIVVSIPVYLLADPPSGMRMDDAMLFMVVYIIIATFVIYPWQIVGTWRAAENHRRQYDVHTWARLAQLFIILGVVSTIAQTVSYVSFYTDVFKFGLRQTEYSHRSITMTEDNTKIHYQGAIGDGAKNEIEQLLINNQDITGIILDSHGGLVREGLAIAELIKAYSLDTYTLDGCYSACTIAFIAGKERQIGTTANLGFHGFSAVFSDLDDEFYNEDSQKTVEELYRLQGVSTAFTDRMFIATEDDMWYPSYAELVDSGVIHGETSTSAIASVSTRELEDEQFIEQIMLKYQSYQLIKKYEPEFFQSLVHEFAKQASKGASLVELQRLAGGYVEKIAISALPLTGDVTIISFVEKTSQLSKKIQRIDPFACVQYFYPDQYGSANLLTFVDENDVKELDELMVKIIDEAYTGPSITINKDKGEAIITRVVEDLGDNAVYLDPENLQGRKDYRMLCDTTISFYERLLEYPRKESANALRYLFSSI
jgi:hypothetical protein